MGPQAVQYTAKPHARRRIAVAATAFDGVSVFLQPNFHRKWESNHRPNTSGICTVTERLGLGGSHEADITEKLPQKVLDQPSRH